MRTAGMVFTGIFVALLIVAGGQAVYGQPKLPSEAASWTYQGHSKCKICHNVPAEGGQYDKWKGEKHAKAFETLKTDAAKKIGEEKGLAKPPHEAPECLKCHVTGYDAAAAKAPTGIKPEDGVQCETCHGPASAHMTLAQKLKFKPEMIAEVDIMSTHIHPDEQLCMGCHNAESPTWNPEKYTKADGTKAGFDFDAAWKDVGHAHPEGVMEKKYGGKYPVD